MPLGQCQTETEIKAKAEAKYINRYLRQLTKLPFLFVEICYTKKARF